MRPFQVWYTLPVLLSPSREGEATAEPAEASPSREGDSLYGNV
jgi:hypothetical protein